jgi:hypothetical protein
MKVDLNPFGPLFGTQESPSDSKLHLLMAEAFTYETSSKGIVKAAVSGDGFTFMR